MNDRLELHSELVSVMGDRPVYFQPPMNVHMSYPCIVYSLDGLTTYHANNSGYRRLNDYLVTLITKDPEDPLFDAILDSIDYVSFDRHYVADNLHHYSFNVKRTRHSDGF